MLCFHVGDFSCTCRDGDYPLKSKHVDIWAHQLCWAFCPHQTPSPSQAFPTPQRHNSNHELWSKERLIWGKPVFWKSLVLRDSVPWTSKKGKNFKKNWRKREKKRGKEHVLHHNWDVLAPPKHQEPFNSPIPSQRWKQKLQNLVGMRHFSFSKSGWCTRYKHW